MSIHTSNGAFAQQPKWRAAVGGNWGADAWHPEISDAAFEPVPGAEGHPLWEGLAGVEAFDEKYSGLDIDDGVTPLVGKDIAEVVRWVATQPPHVVIADVLVYPVDQAGSGKLARRGA